MSLAPPSNSVQPSFSHNKNNPPIKLLNVPSILVQVAPLPQGEPNPLVHSLTSVHLLSGPGWNPGGQAQ